MKSYFGAFVMGGAILTLWLASYKWVEGNYREQSSAPTPILTPPPVASQQKNTTGGHNTQQQQSNSGGINTQQSSSGPNSPPISGNNNRVIIYSGPQAPHIQPKQQTGFREAASNKVSITVGGVTASYDIENLKKPHGEVLRLGGQYPIKLHIKDDILFCDVELWAGGSGPSIEIKDNQFTVNPEGWDKNFSDNAFEVINQEGAPVFQLIRKTPSHYVIYGYIFVPGSVVVANEDGIGDLAGMASSRKLKPIFKYPSWKYQGKYVDY